MLVLTISKASLSLSEQFIARSPSPLTSTCLPQSQATWPQYRIPSSLPSSWGALPSSCSYAMVLD
jgi:hypothetical protein